MAAESVIAASLALVIVILASILGAVTRRERLPFVLGIGLFIAAHAVVPGAETVAVLLAVVGIALAVGSTVPLLRESV